MALIAAFTAIFTNYLVRANLGGALEVRRIPDRGHIIVCGLGNIGYRVVEELLRYGESVVVIERGRDNPFIATARRLKVAVIIGDATIREVLLQAKAASARAVVAATSNELVNLEIALLVRELAPRQRVVVRVIEPNLAQTLRQAVNIKFALSIPELAAPAFVASLFGDRVRGIVLVAGRMFTVYDLRVRENDFVFTSQPLAKVSGDFRFVPVHWVRQAAPRHRRAREAGRGRPLDGDHGTRGLATPGKPPARSAAHLAANGDVAPPNSSNKARYHFVTSSTRPGKAFVPQTTDKVRRVWSFVLVRWASLTALAQGPSASNRHSKPPTSMLWPDALKTYAVPTGATSTCHGSRAWSRSTTLMGRPLWRETMLQTSTQRLIVPSALSATALRRYSDAGLLRPVGLKPPWRRRSRTRARTSSSL